MIFFFDILKLFYYFIRILPPSALDEEADYPIDDENYDVNYNYTFFHFIFAIAAMYVAMLLTDW